MSIATEISELSTVRSTNDLYRAYGTGRVQKLRNGQAKVEFNPSVFMPPPYRSENKILAVEQLEVVDSPLDRAKRGQWDEPWRFELKMLAARFLTGNKGGQLSNARTAILPHQIFAAHRVVSAEKRRFLLADEVGLGKTIEAGMIWQALEQRGQAKRTLIIVPAGLTTQWQEEMKDKFDTDFEIFGRDFWAVNPMIWNLKARAIASVNMLKRPEHKKTLLENRRWDLIIFDEAHRLSAVSYASKIDKTLNYQLAEVLRGYQYCDALLLLTATPHQGEENHSRFKNLLNLLDDFIDFSPLEEEGLFSGGANGGRPFTELIIRTPKQDVTDAEGRKVFKGRQTHRMPFKMYADEEKFYKAVAAYIRDGYRMLERLSEPTQRRAAGFLLTTFQKLNASSTAAIRAALSKRLARLRGEIEAMPEPTEADEELLRDDRFEGELEEERAALVTEEQILESEARTIEELLALRVKRDRKMDELLKLIERIESEAPRGIEEKVLIFTEYRETQKYIVRELEKKHGKGCVVVIHGGMKLERREESAQDIDAVWQPFGAVGALDSPTTKRTSQRLFRDHPKVRFLVSTEAGGEGINLQFSHICVNYDLPWNPMRVEQRVGRVYRFGQKLVVQVYNFFNRGTIEDTVQRYFEDRIQRAAEAIARVTGEDPEDIMGTLNGQLEGEIDPKQVYQRAMVEGNLNRQTKEEIDKAVTRAQRAYEIAMNSLFRDVSSYTFDHYRRELKTELTLEDLRRFTERFLARHRRQLQQHDPFVEFLTPDVLRAFGLPERYRKATFDRELAIRRTDAEFLALGHEFVDAMLGYVGSYDFGGLTAIRRVSDKERAGISGYLFAFVVRRRITREHGDECLFDFQPVFVRKDGVIDDAAAAAAVNGQASDSQQRSPPPDPVPFFDAARSHLEKAANLWDWDEDVEFIGMSFVYFE